MVFHTKDTVIFSETSNKTLNDKTTMYYFVDGDTLHLKFAKSGNRIPSNLNKELTVYLPEGMELDEPETVSVERVSGDSSIVSFNSPLVEFISTFFAAASVHSILPDIVSAEKVVRCHEKRRGFLYLRGGNQ